jgi:hypothetical protein
MSTLPDSADFAIPFAGDDQFIEFDPSDADFGDPAEWPAWTDEDHWELGPGYDPATLVPPELDDDDAPLPDPYEGQDWLEYDAWARRLEAIHQGKDDPGYLSDRDIITAQGGAG